MSDPIESAADSTPEDPDANMELGDLSIEDEGEHDEAPDKPETREVVETEEAQAQPIKAAAVNASPSRASIAKAVRLGLEDDEIADYDTEADLQKAIKLMERRKGAENSGEPKKPAAPDAKRPKVDDIPDLDPESFDETLTKGWSTLKGLAKHHESRADALEQRLEQLVQVIQHSHATQSHERFDGTVNGLKKPDLFGEGDVNELEDANHVANRQKLFAAREDLIQGMQKRGEKIPSEKKIVEKAYRMVFGETIKSEAREELAQGIKKRGNMITRPPTQRRSADAMDSTGKAVNSVKAKLEALGKQ